MIEVYAFATPNSIKVPLALEEAGLAYDLKRINVRTGEQRDPAFVALNPNAKVPVLVDPEGPDGRLVLTESAAILIYIAEKTGTMLPAGGTARARGLNSCCSTPPRSAPISATPAGPKARRTRPHRRAFRVRRTG